MAQRIEEAVPQCGCFEPEELADRDAAWENHSGADFRHDDSGRLCSRNIGNRYHYVRRCQWTASAIWRDEGFWVAQWLSVATCGDGGADTDCCRDTRGCPVCHANRAAHPKHCTFVPLHITDRNSAADKDDLCVVCVRDCGVTATGTHDIQTGPRHGFQELMMLRG